MNDIYKNYWDWAGLGFEIGYIDKQHIFKPNILKNALTDIQIKIIKGHTEDAYRIYKLKNNIITHIYTLKEAKRLLKLSKL